jgi:hypothetical protein
MHLLRKTIDAKGFVRPSVLKDHNKLSPFLMDGESPFIFNQFP